MLTSSEQKMRERLEKEEQDTLESMTTKDRIKWAEEHNIRPPNEGKKAKTVNDPEKDFQLKCGEKKNFSVMASKRAEQRVAQELLDGTGVDLHQTDELHYIRALKWKSEVDQASVRRLMVNDAPKVPDTHVLQTVCTDGVSVHLTYGVKGEPGAVDKDKDDGDDKEEDNPKDIPLVGKDVHKLMRDQAVKFAKGAPKSSLRDQVVLTCDPGVGEETIVATSSELLRQLERAARGEDVDQDFLRLDNASKVRGNEQLSAKVFETIARTRQHRAAEQHALVKANAKLATVERPTTVEALQRALRILVRATSVQELEQTISTRASVAPGLLFAYFRPEYRQGRRDKMLATKRFAEQLARLVLDMALEQSSPMSQPYPTQRWKIASFSEATRQRQQREQWRQSSKPRKKKPPLLKKELVLLNGNWSRPGGNSGMSRAAGSFPRVAIHTRMERSLTHRAKHQQGLLAFHSGVLDEYRTSKQVGKLWALLADHRTDKVNPKAGTVAYTTEAGTWDIPKQFTIVENKKHKLLQYADLDGVTRVTRRDEPTNATMAARYVYHRQNNTSPVSISRASIPKAAQSSARSRKAKDTHSNVMQASGL